MLPLREHRPWRERLSCAPRLRSGSRQQETCNTSISPKAELKVGLHVFLNVGHQRGCKVVRDGQRSTNSRSHVEYRIMNVTIVIYYTALLNAVERSVDLHGPSQLPVVNSVLGC